MITFDPIYNNLFYVDFQIEDLEEYCVKIDENYFYFNLNEVNKGIVPLRTVINLIENNKKLNISIYIQNRTGELISVIYLQNTTFLKIEDLLNFDYAGFDILKLKVNYKYEKMKFFTSSREFLLYQRMQKIEQLNKI